MIADFQRALIRFTNGTVEHPAYALQLLKTDIDDETLSDLRANIAGLTGSIEMCVSPCLVYLPPIRMPTMYTNHR